MKKYKIISLLALISIIASYIILPMDAHADANTLAEFRAEVEQYTNKLEENQNKIAKNDEEVAQIRERISEIEKELDSIVEEIGTLQTEIDESNKEIEEKSEESKKIIEYYQLANGENAYLEYAFGATSITDMIYRMSVVEQLTEYNDRIMKELDTLIAKNKQQQEELTTKQEQQQNLQKELESERERINADTAALKDAQPGIQEQIKAAKNNVKYYESIGCGENENIQSCQIRYDRQHASSGGSGGGGNVMPPSASGFYRPMESGYVTQNWMNAGHLGIDLGNRNYNNIEIHPVATGVVFAKYYDNAGALVLKIRHYVNGSYLYSTYAHLSAWYVNVGDIVSPDTVIGRMGSTGNSSGPHLHLEITTCDWNTGGGCTWAQYQRSTLNPRNYIGFPSGLYSWWYGR